MGRHRKKIVLLSDSFGLSRAIELNLTSCLDAEVIEAGLVTPPNRNQAVGSCDLIIVAASSAVSEPVVVLSKASLAEKIGRVPLLIISDRPFPADPIERIEHLDFPFDIDELQYKVKDIFDREGTIGAGDRDTQFTAHERRVAQRRDAVPREALYQVSGA